MNIAIDYDDTITADPELFSLIIRYFQLAKHRVFCITARNATLANSMEIKETFRRLEIVDVPVHFTGGEPKIEYAKRNALAIDIWIDDNPFSLTVGH